MDQGAVSDAKVTVTGFPTTIGDAHVIGNFYKRERLKTGASRVPVIAGSAISRHSALMHQDQIAGMKVDLELANQ